jgi:hypothetical protein
MSPPLLVFVVRLQCAAAPRCCCSCCSCFFLTDLSPLRSSCSFPFRCVRSLARPHALCTSQKLEQQKEAHQGAAAQAAAQARKHTHARTHKQGTEANRTSDRSSRPTDTIPLFRPHLRSLFVGTGHARAVPPCPTSLTLQTHGLLLAKRTTPAEAATFRPPTVSRTSL